ncbi:MAG: TRAP transporter small permease [Desulfamplus sp.]|nr:TRAP transporter small permease [Desulfamplus sp.]MBF0259368.1 TRAP transporter small permease [Desulfamplus sp.]
MKSFWFFMDKLQDYMRMAAAVCIVAMATITCSDIVLRVTLNSPIFGSEEIVSICAILTIAFSMPYAHKKDVHIGVEILVRLFSHRTQAIIKAITNILSAILMFIISWRMFLFAGSIAKSGERSMNLQLPMYYFSYILAGCFLIFAIFILKDIIMFFTGAKEER